MDRTTLRRTLTGALTFGGATTVLATVQALRAGTSFGDALPLVLFFGLLAGTVGALAGPLVGGVVARMRGEDRT